MLEVVHQAQQTGVPLFVQALAGALQALLQLVELFPLPGEVFGGMDEPVGEPLPRNNDRLLGIVLGVNCVALLVLPVALGPLLAWMRNAFAHLS